MKFDVFVSFRGTDTRRNFVSHLCHSLFKHRFRIFKHEEDLLEGQPAPRHVLQAIEESKIAVVVISHNYAYSYSCLDELVKIIECKEKQSLVVVPIFYRLRSSGSTLLADKLEMHGRMKRSSRDWLKTVRTWMDEMNELLQTFRDYASSVEEDSDMIDKVMEYISPYLRETRSSESRMLLAYGSAPRTSSAKVLEKFQYRPRTITKMFDEDEPPIESVEEKDDTGNELSGLVPSSDFNSLVGMDRQLKAVDTLLDLDSEDGTLEIGIWGEVGIGKTTLSRYVYEHISPKFQDHYYYKLLNDTAKSYSRTSTCLLEEITRAVITKDSSNLLTSYCDDAKAKLGHRKVLLIIDGADQNGQLENIRKVARWFGPGSRLILVTKDMNLLLRCEVSRLYEVESLNYDEALQLFSQFAFKQSCTLKGFEQLCVRAVFIAGRLPLSLKVFGSLLCGKNIKEWEFELLRLEASQANCTAIVSSYIRAGFFQRRPTKQDRHIVGEDDKRDDFPSYCFA